MSTPTTAALAAAGLPTAPEALESTHRETRRLIVQSEGLAAAVVGVNCLVLAALFLQTWCPPEPANLIYFLPLLLTLIVVGATAQNLVRKARLRAGIPKVTPPQRQPRANRRMLWFVLAASLGVGVLAAVTSMVFPESLHRIGVTLIMLVAALPLARRGFQLGLWELVLQAAAIPVAFALLFVGRWPSQIGWMLLAFGVTHAITGWCLHRRWKAWVAALPGPAADRTTDAEASA